MVKLGFIKTIKKNKYFNKLFTPLIILLLLIIILFFVFNKSIENLDVIENGIQKGQQSMECFIWVVGTETSTKDSNLNYSIWPTFKFINKDDTSIIFETHQHINFGSYFVEVYPKWLDFGVDVSYLKDPSIFPIITCNLRHDITRAPMKNDIFVINGDITYEKLNKGFIDYKNKHYSELYTNGQQNSKRRSTQPDKSEQIKPAS